MRTSQRVLVADGVNGRSRSAVAAVRALAAAGYSPWVAVTGRPAAAARSRAAAGTFEVPAPESPELGTVLRALVTDGRFACILPSSDGVLCSVDPSSAALVDKSALAQRVTAAGLPVPETVVCANAEELMDAGARLGCPVVVKPAVKQSARSVARVAHDEAALAVLAQDMSGPCVVQPFHTDGLRAVAGVVHGGRLLAVVHQRYLRTWPADCGVASAAVSTEPDVDLEERLVQLLDGHDGVFQVQLIGERVIDVNPRVYGSLPLAVAAGTNLPAIACDARRGVVPPRLLRGRAGIRYRWAEGDLRSLLHGLRGGSYTLAAATRALAPRRGTAHSIESLWDPGPVLSRLVHAAGGAR